MIELMGVEQTGARIRVVGVGGGGGNALNTMVKSGLQGVVFVACNTDSQALIQNAAEIKIQMGENLTRGLGAGANPEIGRSAAMESKDRLAEVLEGADMVFVTAGMGGGTGTGGAPVVAEVARSLGCLTVGVVTRPFVFEGRRRARQAEEGIKALKQSVDTLITIPNQKLIDLAGENTALLDAFTRVDQILLNAVRGISDLVTVPGMINVDFADVRTVMQNRGMALMGTGAATGSNRALEAAHQAVNSPLLAEVAIQGATGILLNISGGPDLRLYEVNEAATFIQEQVHEEANIILGSVIDPNMKDEIKITVIATGFETCPELLSERPRLGAQADENLDIPTIIRRNQRHNELQSAPPPVLERVPLARPAPARTALREPARDAVRTVESQAATAAFNSVSVEEEEYDVPTFLRRPDR